METTVLDFETRSTCNLKVAGAYRYAEDPTTEILCLCWDFRPGVWTPGQPVRDTTLYDMICRGVRLAAHNAGFEKAIWRRIMVPEYGWPDAPDDQWVDTMAVCASRALPQALDRAVRVLGLPIEKDTAGSKMTVGLSKFNKAGYLPAVTSAVLDGVITYCAQDVRTQRALYTRLGELTPDEREVWLLDQTINQRGIRLDVPLVRKMREIVDKATVPLAREFQEITGGLKFTQIGKFGDWTKARGVFLPDLTAETVAAALGHSPDIDPDDIEIADALPMPDDVRRALEIRQLIGSASVKKLAAAEACVMADGRARGLLQYHGAAPGRWAGRLLQPHNFPRGTLKEAGEAPAIDPLVNALMTGDPAYVEMIYGPAVETVVSSLRHVIVSDPGEELGVGDFAGIEARITLALAGAYEKVAMMAGGQDVYCDMAAQIYKRPIDKHRDRAERQVGKNAVLGLGFQMGARKFLLKYGNGQSLEFCEGVVDVYRKEWAPEVPRLWYALQRAATKAVWDRAPQEAYGIRYALEDGFLTAIYPDGSKCWYYDPQPIREAMPWDETDVRLSWTYKAMKAGKWTTIKAFGGLLTENAAQHMARQLLVAAMKMCEAAGFPIILTVHDEIVARRVPAKSLEQIMTDVPGWAKEIGIPVAAECWNGERYKK